MDDQDHTTCRQLLSSLSEYIDGSLSDSLCAELEEHLHGCQNCQIVLDTLKKTISLYRTTSEADSLPGDVRQRLFACLNLADYIEKDPQ